MRRAQRVCEVTRDIDLWLAAVDLNDALTAYFQSHNRLYDAAREVGMTNEQWRSVLRGAS
jgi:hypothetical protein